MSEQRIIIFDFCGTLIRFQTADRYVNFCVERLKENRTIQCRHRLVQCMDILRIFKIYNRIKTVNNWRKRMILWQLKGVRYETCDRLAQIYFEKELMPNIYKPVVDKLKEYVDSGENVYILSGGYNIYIKYFARYYGVKNIICSKIAFKENVCTGQMEGKDCMRENKVDYIRPFLGELPMVCYTDSISDLPLLEIASEPIVVSNSALQDWATKRNYKQIVVS